MEHNGPITLLKTRLRNSQSLDGMQPYKGTQSILRKGMHRERIKQASQSEREKHGIEKDGSDESVHIAAPEMKT